MWLVQQEGLGFYVFETHSGSRMQLPPQNRRVAEALARAMNAGEREAEQAIFDSETLRRAQGS